MEKHSLPDLVLRRKGNTIFVGKLLFYASIAYLALPLFLFFPGYLQWYLALGMEGFLAFGLFYGVKAVRQSRKRVVLQANSSQVILTAPQIFLLLVVVLGWMLVSGVGGYGFQDEDWVKHNAVLHDLIHSPWPLSYAAPTEQLPLSSDAKMARFPLVYYVAYYLPAAMIGKFAGWFWAQQFLFLWTYLGVCLALLWFLVLVGRSTWPVLLLFVVFSGLDSVGLSLIRILLHQPLLIRHWDQIELWSGNWQYSANTSLVFWVPNQAISGWMISAMLLYLLRVATLRSTILFYISLTALWSPFITLGLTPLLFADLVLGAKPFSKKLREYFSLPNGCGVVLLFLFGAFYSTKLYPTGLPLPSIQKGLIFLSPRIPGLFWYETLVLLLAFFLLEVGIYAIIISTAGRKFLHPRERTIFSFLMLFLFILPFYRYGYWNDIVMRASIPALFLICVFTVRTFSRLSWKQGATFVLVITLLLGAATPLIEFKRHVKGMQTKTTLFELPRQQPLYDVHYPVDPAFFLQYIGKAETPFFTYMAKPLNNSLRIENLEFLNRSASSH